ncbi:MAG: manganese efflux pump [Clostridiales bacterium]|nr:manganese efflux pump [Clostridiales bacterium]
MGLWELFVIALGLSMDAFAVSICKGLSVRRCTMKHMLICGLYFGVFQGAMPLLGYILGSQFESLVTTVAPYIAFGLLALIGFNMIREAREDDDSVDDDFSVKAMIPLAIATSIDALAIGVSFAFLQVSIIPAVSFIAVTTFACCVVGVKVGSIFGSRYKHGAEFFGGLVLILMGFKILMEHLVG